METLIGMSGLAALFWFGYALFKPEKAVYWHENPSRTKAFGYLLLVLFVFGSISPDSEGSVSEKTETGDKPKADAQTETTAEGESSTGTQAESSGENETSGCELKSGEYVGKYTATTPSGPEQGGVFFTLRENCAYKLTMEGDIVGDGKAKPKSKINFELENGNIVRIKDGNASMEEIGINYRATYEMSIIE